MIKVNIYNSRKIKDIIRPGYKILLEYECGLGDVIMFLPYFERLKQLFPNTIIHLKTKNQKKYFPYVENENYYNYVFKLNAHFNEETVSLQHLTKPECNCVIELGIPYQKELEYSYIFPHEKKSPFVGVSFCNSCFPDRINCGYDTSKLIWTQLKENGFVPIELFSPTYKEAWEREENKKFDFVDCSMREMGNNLERMLSVMANCCGCASVATGNFHFAMTIYPEKILYLKNKFTYKYFTNKQILELDVKNPDMGILKEWMIDEKLI